MFKFPYTAEHTQQVVRVPQPYLPEVVSLLPGRLPPLLATPAPRSPPSELGFSLLLVRTPSHLCQHESDTTIRTVSQSSDESFLLCSQLYLVLAVELF